MADEPKLVRRGPLDHWGEELVRASANAMRIEVAPFSSVLNLRGLQADESLITDVRRILGIELPLVPNRWRGGKRVAAVWLGPDEWLIIAPDGRAGDIEKAMRDARPTDPRLSLVDVSHNYTCLRLWGSQVHDVLTKG